MYGSRRIREQGKFGYAALAPVFVGELMGLRRCETRFYILLEVVIICGVIVRTQWTPSYRSKMPKEEVDEAQQAKYEEVAGSIRALYADKEFNDKEEQFEVLSTIRYDPLLTDTVDFSVMFDGASDNSRLFFLFDEHLHRTNFALEYFGFGFQLTREQLLNKLNEALAKLDKSEAYKLRLTIDKTGKAMVTVVLTPQRFNLLDGFNSPGNYSSPLWNVYIDTEPIMISPFTSFKTTRRQRYSDARERMFLKDSEQPQEVLLYNTANQVTEGSITNLAFKDPSSQHESWITPPLSAGCLCGVVRHMLLSKGLVTEKQVNLKDVKVGDDVLLFNGIMGVVKGKIVDPARNLGI